LAWKVTNGEKTKETPNYIAKQPAYTFEDIYLSPLEP
jgi:hypothetical protein